MILGLIFWTIVILCYVFRKQAKKVIGFIFYPFFYYILPVFSKRVSDKYIRLIDNIHCIGICFRTVKDETHRTVIEVLDSDESPIMKWEVYRHVYYNMWDVIVDVDYSTICLKCQYLTGFYQKPFIKEFPTGIDQVIMFNTTLQGLNQLRMEAMEREKGEG